MIRPSLPQTERRGGAGAGTAAARTVPTEGTIA